MQNVTFHSNGCHALLLLAGMAGGREIGSDTMHWQVVVDAALGPFSSGQRKPIMIGTNARDGSICTMRWQLAS